MKQTTDRPFSLFFVAIAALVAATACIVVPAESAVNARTDAARRDMAAARSGEALLARRGEYEASAERVRTELGVVQLDAPPGSLLASYLEAFDDAARRHGIEIAAINPRHDLTAVNSDAFDARVDGTFSQIAAFADDVARLDTLAELQSFRIERKSDGLHAGAVPRLEAQLSLKLVPLRTGDAEGS